MESTSCYELQQYSYAGPEKAYAEYGSQLFSMMSNL